jgi:hypothetical protein
MPIPKRTLRIVIKKYSFRRGKVFQPSRGKLNSVHGCTEYASTPYLPKIENKMY